LHSRPGTARGTSFTWSGAAPSTEHNWSSPGNWEGGTAPNGAVETLIFPALANPGCANVPPAAACYYGVNNLIGLGVNAISIDDGVGYFIEGNAITLGAGGITAATSVTASRGATVRMPIMLAAPQTWTISANQGLGNLGIEGTVTGAADALNVRLANQASLGVTGDVEVGSVTVMGSGAGLQTGIVAIGPSTGSLNASDGNPVSFTGGAGLVGFGGAIGPVTMSGGEFQVGDPGPSNGTFTVTGTLTLESTELSSFVARAGGVPGVDYSQLRVTGGVKLANARLRLSNVTPTCPALTPGEVLTLLTAEGSLTGTFAGVPDGGQVPVSCSASAPMSARINYTAHAVTATIRAGPAEQVPAPVLGKRETVQVLGGIVTVRTVGTISFVPLTGTMSVPDGSELDTTHGRALVTAATATPGTTRSAEAYTGRFVIHQERTKRAETHLTLSLPLSGCPSNKHKKPVHRSLRAAAGRILGPKSRHLWVSDRGGHWGTNARYLSTSIEGTRWLTFDACNRSVVIVTTGRVSVRDLVSGRVKVLSAGQRYQAVLGRSRRTRP
jgi:hypothetical protein